MHVYFPGNRYGILFAGLLTAATIWGPIDLFAQVGRGPAEGPVYRLEAPRPHQPAVSPNNFPPVAESTMAARARPAEKPKGWLGLPKVDLGRFVPPGLSRSKKRPAAEEAKSRRGWPFGLGKKSANEPTPDVNPRAMMRQQSQASLDGPLGSFERSRNRGGRAMSPQHEAALLRENQQSVHQHSRATPGGPLSSFERTRGPDGRTMTRRQEFTTPSGRSFQHEATRSRDGQTMSREYTRATPGGPLGSFERTHAPNGQGMTRLPGNGAPGGRVGEQEPTRPWEGGVATHQHSKALPGGPMAHFDQETRRDGRAVHFPEPMQGRAPQAAARAPTRPARQGFPTAGSVENSPGWQAARRPQAAGPPPRSAGSLAGRSNGSRSRRR